MSEIETTEESIATSSLHAYAASLLIQRRELAVSAIAMQRASDNAVLAARAAAAGDLDAARALKETSERYLNIARGG